MIYQSGALTEDQELNLNAGDPVGGKATAADVLAYCCADSDNCPEDSTPNWRTLAPFSKAKPADCPQVPTPTGQGGTPYGTAPATNFLSKKVGIFPVPLLIAGGLVVLWLAMRGRG